jgi:hypothetical protein
VQTAETTGQSVHTQVQTVEKKVREVEKTGQTTHRRTDALDNSLGQLDKLVVVLMRVMDSKFQHEVEKIRNNESGERTKFQVEFERSMETKLEGWKLPSEDTRPPTNIK